MSKLTREQIEMWAASFKSMYRDPRYSAELEIGLALCDMALSSLSPAGEGVEVDRVMRHVDELAYKLNISQEENAALFAKLAEAEARVKALEHDEGIWIRTLDESRARVRELTIDRDTIRAESIEAHDANTALRSELADLKASPPCSGVLKAHVQVDGEAIPLKSTPTDEAGMRAQREAITWALLPPQDWDSYPVEKARQHTVTLQAMRAALSAPPQRDEVREWMRRGYLLAMEDGWKMSDSERGQMERLITQALAQGAQKEESK